MNIWYVQPTHFEGHVSTKYGSQTCLIMQKKNIHTFTETLAGSAFKTRVVLPTFAANVYIYITLREGDGYIYIYVFTIDFLIAEGSVCFLML